jgi:hypothetical protein
MASAVKAKVAFYRVVEQSRVFVLFADVRYFQVFAFPSFPFIIHSFSISNGQKHGRHSSFSRRRKEAPFL